MEFKDGIAKANSKLVIEQTRWGIRYKSGRFFDLLADQTLADSILILLQKNDGTERVGYKTGLIVTPVKTPDQFGLNGMEEIIFTQSQQVDRELFFTYGQRYVFGNNFFA